MDTGRLTTFKGLGAPAASRPSRDNIAPNASTKSAVEENKFLETKMRPEKKKSVSLMSMIEESEEVEEQMAPAMEYETRQDKVSPGKQAKIPFAKLKNGSPSRIATKKAIVVPETIAEEEENS